MGLIPICVSYLPSAAEGEGSGFQNYPLEIESFLLADTEVLQSKKII